MVRWLKIVPKYLVWIPLLLATLTVADYVFGRNSDSLAFATHLVSNSPAIQRVTGDVLAVRLHWFWGFEYQSGFGNSTSSLDLHVAGAKASLDLSLDLKQVNGEWTVVRSTVPL